MAARAPSAMIGFLDADGAVSPGKAAAPAEEPRKRLDTVWAVALLIPPAQANLSANL